MRLVGLFPFFGVLDFDCCTLFNGLCAVFIHQQLLNDAVTRFDG